jgi:hypothetical protein
LELVEREALIVTITLVKQVLHLLLRLLQQLAAAVVVFMPTLVATEALAVALAAKVADHLRLVDLELLDRVMLAVLVGLILLLAAQVAAVVVLVLQEATAQLLSVAQVAQALSLL